MAQCVEHKARSVAGRHYTYLERKVGPIVQHPVILESRVPRRLYCQLAVDPLQVINSSKRHNITPVTHG